MQLTPRGADLTSHRRPLDALTGIRFLAASYVILFHTRFSLDARARHAGPLDIFLGSGFLAVTLFFMLSGFILAYTYEGQIQTRGDHRRFWEARFARIWPLYAASLLFTSLVGRSVPRLPVALATLLMVQSWNPFNPGLAAAWSVVCWTLSVEALFYLLFPFAQTWMDRRSTRMQIIVLAVIVLLCLACNVSWRTLDYDPVIGVYRFIPLAVIHVPEFLAGVAIGNLYLRWIGAARRAGPVGSGWLTWIAALACFAVLSLRTVPATSIAVPAFAALLFGLAAEPSLLRRVLSTRPLLIGGQISYGMYLLHIACKTLVSLAFNHYGITSGAVRFSAEFLATVLLSFVTFKTIENPARKVLRAAFLRWEKHRARTV